MVWGELFCFVCFPFCSYGLGVSLGKGYIFVLREIKITPDAFVHTCTVYHLYLIHQNCHSSIKIKKKYFTVTYNNCGKNIKISLRFLNQRRQYISSMCFGIILQNSLKGLVVHNIRDGLTGTVSLGNEMSGTH